MSFIKDIMGNKTRPKAPSLFNAEKIRQSGLAQLSSLKKSYEEEAEAFFASEEFAKQELSSVYWRLRRIAGEEAANEFITKLASTPF